MTFVMIGVILVGTNEVSRSCRAPRACPLASSHHVLRHYVCEPPRLHRGVADNEQKHDRRNFSNPRFYAAHALPSPGAIDWSAFPLLYFGEEAKDLISSRARIMDDDEEAHRKRKAPEGDEDQAKTSGAVVNHLISSQAPLTERGTSAPLTDDTVKNEATKVITTEAPTEIGGSVTVLSSKGYRTARSTLVVNEGAWYFEVVVAHLGDSGHVRVGWSTNKCELNAPVGFDQHGYGYCDVSGDKVHHRNRESYGEAYAAGDVVGCYIYVKPAEGAADAGAKEFDLNTRDGVDGGAEVEDCNTRTCADDCVGNAAEASHAAEEEGGKILRADGTDDDRSAHDGAHLENKEAVGTQQAEVSDAPGAPGSSNTAAAAAGDGGCVAFVKNGVFQGAAYHLKPSTRSGFSPTVSLFTHGKVEPAAKVAFNFGPKFVHALSSDFSGTSSLPSPKPLLSGSESSTAAWARKDDKYGSTEEGTCAGVRMNDDIS